MSDFRDLDANSIDRGVTRSGEFARLLGRIEATLLDMRRDIQAGTRAQENMLNRLELMDRRVGILEVREANRTRVSRIVAVIGLALLLPTINAVHHVHGWFDAVTDQSFPKGKP